MLCCWMALKYRRYHHVLRQARYPCLCYSFQYWASSQYQRVHICHYLDRSCFLATPKTQIKDMFKKARIWFTIAYLGSTIMTIVLACTLPENLRFLVLISIVVEIASYFFYTLSFIPYGQKVLGKVCKFMIASDWTTFFIILFFFTIKKIHIDLTSLTNLSWSVLQMIFKRVMKVYNWSIYSI